jgi:NAD(P)-dependent dehydrogenase (short-subunit alcohol dehydrogenase family)
VKAFRLDGKVAIVTGSSTGLGSGIAQHLAEAGADVVVTSRTQDSLGAVTGVVEAAGRRCLPVELDVVDLRSIEAMVVRTKRTFGRLDILVNNAGINIRGPALDVTEGQWDAVVDTNLKGVFFCSQAVAREMIPQGSGSIINLASTMGVVALENRATYCASKGGVVLLTKQLAVEWAPHGIRVNAVAPTFVLTNMTSGVLADPAVRARVLDRIPMGRIGEIDEVANAVVFLASPASSFVTGAILPVEGGYLAR